MEMTLLTPTPGPLHEPTRLRLLSEESVPFCDDVMIGFCDSDPPRMDFAVLGPSDFAAAVIERLLLGGHHSASES